VVRGGGASEGPRVGTSSVGAVVRSTSGSAAAAAAAAASAAEGPRVGDEAALRMPAVGGSHDQEDAEWIVSRGQLRGHNDTTFGWPAPGRPSGRPGSGLLTGVFCMF
jgi:hypothetical protein